MATIKWDIETDPWNPGYLVVLENGDYVMPAPRDYHYAGRSRRRLRQIVAAALRYHCGTEITERIHVEPRA